MTGRGFFRSRQRRFRHTGSIRWDLLFGLGLGAILLAASRDESSQSPISRMSSGADNPVEGWKLIALPAATYGAYKLLTLPMPGPTKEPPRQPEVLRQAQKGPPPSTLSESPASQWPASLWESVLRKMEAAPGPKSIAESGWIPPSDSKWLDLVRHPSVVLIIGKRGGGKSALGYRILELLRTHGEPYVVGLPAKARKLLPDWVGTMERLDDVPPKAVVLVDESYLRYHSRATTAPEGRDIGSLINLSRQKEQTLLFIVQEARQLDVNIVSQMDILAVKELSDLSKGFERPQLRTLTDKARAAFSTVQRDYRQWTWVYSEPAGFEGLVRNEVASFWTPRLSRAFVHTSSQAAPQRRGTRPSREELKGRVLEMRQAGLSYGHMARNLGVSKTKAWRLVNEG